jgi:transcriptional regulator with XRE-family HTH domain
MASVTTVRDNHGARRLRELFQGRGSVSELAVKVGVDASLASRWLSGERTPDTKNRARIEDLFGVGWRLWDEPVEPAGSAA